VVESARRAFKDEAALQSPYEGEEAWPELRGCLAITSLPRSGGTYLSQEIERRFDIGPIREALNPPQIAAFARQMGTCSPAATLKMVVKKFAGSSGWFGFKAGPKAMLLGEQLGFIEQYWSEMVFVFLLRRDPVAQAVSMAKVRLSGRYHSTQPIERHIQSSDYSYELIEQSLRSIWQGVTLLSQYHRAADREPRRIYYEDFCDGDFGSVEGVIAALGLTGRTAIADGPRKAVTKIGDEINLQWSDQFRTQAGTEVLRILKQYEALFSR
jgi:LPS sulfotransferase NodH